MEDRRTLPRLAGAWLTSALLALAILTWTGLPARAAGDGDELTAESEGTRESTGTPAMEALPEEHSDINARIFIPCRPDSVWLVLTDYDHLREFIPDMVESRMLEDHGSTKLIEQTGKGKWFLFGKQARVVLEVEENKYSRLDFHVVDGDFNLFDGSWRLYPKGRGTLLTYRLSLKPKFFAPAFMVRKALSSDVPDRLAAIRDLVVNLTTNYAGLGTPNIATGASK